VTVADVYRALWRHKIFIVVGTAIVLGIAWYLTSTKPKIYEASTLIRVQQRIDDPTQALGALQTGERLVRTYARIARTATIAAKIADQLKGTVPPGEVYGSIRAHQVEDLELLSITARSRNPRHAALIANAAPAALRSFIAQTGTTRDQVITVQSAGVPRSPSSPDLQFNLLMALLLGLILNGGLALLAELLLDRVSGLDELERVAQRPVLATVPMLEFQPLRGEPAPRAPSQTFPTGRPQAGRPARSLGRGPHG
jgi:capsular polysaccharide biosynthesis protein